MIPIPETYDAFGDITAQAKEVNEREQARKQEEERYNNKMFYEALSTPAGMHIYNYFKKFTLDLPSIMPGMSHDQAMVHGNRREGQNDIIREMRIRAERGKQGI